MQSRKQDFLISPMISYGFTLRELKSVNESASWAIFVVL